MSCCGKNRLQAAGRPEKRSLPGRQAIFEYGGVAAIIVVGPVTGRRYHFAGPGARVDVDVRDRQYLMAIPHLRVRI
jgi:hypothetical protein